MLVNIDSYIPTTIADVVFHSASEKEKIEDIINGYMPFPFSGKNGILLYGLWGTGKTTLAKLLPDAIEQGKGGIHSNYFYHACQQGQNGAALLNKITQSAAFVSLTHSGYHYFVLDEVDNLTDAAQASLKSAMNMPQTIFIMTTNHIEKIEKGVLNRCHLIEFNAAASADWLPLAHRILNDMNVTGVADNLLLQVIATCKGSARDILASIVEVGLKRQRALQATANKVQIPANIII